jgi:thiamine-phosphate pyrophosphorylase
MDLRLMVITDRELARPRNVIDIVDEVLQAGAPAIQLRDKSATAADLLALARSILPLARAHGALLIVNDRLDVALAAGADGVHLGPDDLPVSAARRIAPPGFVIGYSTDDPERARAAERDGASYIGCGAVFGTSTKAEAAAEQIGPGGLDRVARAVSIPVIGIGGIGPANAASLKRTAAAGVAVVSAIMAATDPAAVTRALLS